jgi:diguanylate cyclase (GGDEF)-like protein/PAS domain S-box-containing protein
VKNRPAPQAIDANAPSWLEILGLKESTDLEWGEVRGAQISAIRQFALVRLFAAVLAASAIYFSLAHRTLSVAIWFGALVLTSGALALPQLRQREFPRLSATRGELHTETWGLIALALAWAVLPVLVETAAQPYEVLVIWAVLTALMAGVTFGLSTAPLGAASFLIIIGSGLGVMSWRLGMPLITGLTFVYTVALTTACLAGGRSYLYNKYAELALKEKNEVVSLLLREFEDSGGDWMWQTDASRCLTHVSPRFALALGMETAELEAKPLLQILAGELWENGKLPAAMHDLAEKLKNRESFSDLIIPVKINGEHHWWELSASPRVDDAGAFIGFRGVGSDVTSARKSADKINHMARFDTLTGMPNRLQINEAVGAAMVQADHWRGRCGFMMIDLDRFKAVNDTLGHPVGDRLLMQVSERLRSIMTSNELAGRLGGDEFAVVIKEVKDPAILNKIAQNIIDVLSQPYEVDHHTLYIGASIGTAMSPRDGRSVETLIRSADLALYRSKDQGGGTFNSYEPQLHVHAEERRVLEIALRKALERNEFQVHYQPVVNAKSGTIESFEALLRWNNADLGMVSPAKFIPIAEDARLIRPIGEWVLRTACMDAMQWPSTVRVAVNVSAEQLHDANFVTTVMSALSQAGLPPHRLELEVTESLFMKEGTAALSVLDKILSLGVRLALDDFGTGYSSLGYLSKTKFSTIKVDRSFVQGAARNAPESLAIIRAVVALADSLGMSTTAEGVETEEECKMINALGCKKIQGYLFGRPMPREDALNLFTQANGFQQAAAG